MGSSLAQVAPSTQPQGKAQAVTAPQTSQQQSTTNNVVDMFGQQSNVTFPGQGGQPRIGQPNMYPNTVGQWDNSSIQPQQSLNSGGKGKG